MEGDHKVEADVVVRRGRGCSCGGIEEVDVGKCGEGGGCEVQVEGCLMERRKGFTTVPVHFCWSGHLGSHASWQRYYDYQVKGERKNKELKGREEVYVRVHVCRSVCACACACVYVRMCV